MPPAPPPPPPAIHNLSTLTTPHNPSHSSLPLIFQDLSLMYKNLAVYDKDETRQCKMHKRRIDTLTELVSPLNIQHFRQVGPWGNWVIG